MAANEIKVQSAAPAKPLSNEERRQRFAEIRSRLGRSRLEVKGEPGKHYFWGPRGDEAELTRLDYLGYRIVREKDPKNPRIHCAGLREDGTYTIGDVILMEVDQDTYDLIIQDNEERSNAAVFGASEAFKNEALKEGCPTFEVPIPGKG